MTRIIGSKNPLGSSVVAIGDVFEYVMLTWKPEREPTAWVTVTPSIASTTAAGTGATAIGPIRTERVTELSVAIVGDLYRKRDHDQPAFGAGEVRRVGHTAGIGDAPPQRRVAVAVERQRVRPLRAGEAAVFQSDVPARR